MRHAGEGSDTQYINLDDFLDKTEVLHVVEKGTLASIAVVENSLQNVSLKIPILLV